MQRVALDEVAGDSDAGGRLFPLRFGRQACAGPARERIGLEQAEMAHRRMRIAFAPAAEGEFARAVGMPVQRALPVLGATLGPAVAEPQPDRAIAAIGDELGVFGVAHRAAGQRMRRHQHAMPRRFVVVGEVGMRRPRRGTDLADLLIALQPAQRGRRRVLRRQVDAIGRAQWIAPERVLDVGEQQLLVLLLVLQAQFQDLQGLRRQRAGLQLRQHAGFDLVPVLQHLRQRGPRQQAAMRPRMRRADALVVTVEQVIPLRIVRAVRRIGAKHETLEEPGGVREMPFGRAGVVHALHHRVFFAQWRGEMTAAGAHAAQAVRQRRNGHDGRGR